jgi:hypothetical protein
MQLENLSVEARPVEAVVPERPDDPHAQTASAHAAAPSATSTRFERADLIPPRFTPAAVTWL